jgi:hypothetical protein
MHQESVFIVIGGFDGSKRNDLYRIKLTANQLEGAGVEGDRVQSMLSDIEIK